MKLKIISDGTPTGTKLIDEDTGDMVHMVSKLTWETDSAEPLSKVTVEFYNIPVEITAKAEVALHEYDIATGEFLQTKSFEKEIKIVSQASGPNGLTLATDTRVFDAQTNEVVGAIQKVTWEATPEGSTSKVKRIKFDDKDW